MALPSSMFLVKAKHESNLEISFTFLNLEFGTTPVDSQKIQKEEGFCSRLRLRLLPVGLHPRTNKRKGHRVNLA